MIGDLRRKVASIALLGGVLLVSAGCGQKPWGA